MMAPVLSPKHCGLVDDGVGNVTTGGFAIFATAVAVQPHLSVHVMVKLPCCKLFHAPGEYCIAVADALAGVLVKA